MFLTRMVANTNKELDKAHACTTWHSRKIEAAEKLIAKQVIKLSALNAELDELRETCSTSARLIREMVPHLCSCPKPPVPQLSGSGSAEAPYYLDKDAPALEYATDHEEEEGGGGSEASSSNSSYHPAPIAPPTPPHVVVPQMSPIPIPPPPLTSS